MTLETKIPQATLGVELLRFIPPVVRKSLISDTEFSASLGLVTDREITLNSVGAVFKQSILLMAVREASRLDCGGVTLPDLQEAMWIASFDRTGPTPRFVLRQELRIAYVCHLGLVSAHRNDRVQMLEAEAARVHLPRSATAHWMALVEDHSLTDEEVCCFAEDLGNTPILVGVTISGTLNQESVHVDVLVPRSVTYYERLIGRWTGEDDIRAYCVAVLPSFLSEVMSLGTLTGLQHGLLLAGHPLILACLAALPIRPEEFHTVAQWSLQRGDAMARCAVLELALLREVVLDETKTVLAEIADSLFVSKQAEDEDFEMLSAAFIFTYGQFSNTRIYAERPNYWRRFAALSQAAMISRCMVPKKGWLVEFSRHLRDTRNRSFEMQGYADMRRGPLWQPQWASPAQLRNEFVGRVISRAATNEAQTRLLGLHDVLLGQGDDGLRSTTSAFSMLIAGPLEDNVPLIQELTGSNLAMVVNGLSEAKPTALSFAPMINSVFIFRMTEELAEKAGQALQRAQYRIEADEPEHIGAALMGLACCAAVTRSIPLADAVFTVIRYYRRFVPLDLGMNTALRIGSIACASRSDMSEWASAIGSLMTDFAFHSLGKDEARALRDYVVELCELIPELWAACGPALAAASAVAH